MGATKPNTRKTKLQEIRNREFNKRKSRVKQTNVNDLINDFNVENIELVLKAVKNPQTGESLYQSSKYEMRFNNLIEKCNDHADLAVLTKNEVIKK